MSQADSERENPLPPEELNGDLSDNFVPAGGYQTVPVVGLGGSAGGIASLVSFFKTVPADPGLAFVVVLHLSPEHESTLPELLQRCTEMDVLQVQDTLRIEPNRVYVIPPRKSLRMVDGHVQLAEPQSDRGRHVAVDLFFRTLADTHGPHSAAVVLSGADGDGAIGIKRIKERGGLTVAQDPDEAEHGGMPRSAISTGMVDWVLPVGEIAAKLLEYYRLEPLVRLPPVIGPQPTHAARPPGSADEAALRDVLSFLRTRTGRDFSYYKRATILRRIGRRMQVNGIDDLQSYLTCLRTRAGESGALLQDLLISVTNFFRDSECFAALEQQIPMLFANKGPNDALRVWVAACATGEEAYSIAILLSEHARTLESPPLIQIFATDLDEEAIQAAREGIYPAAIEADLSEERLRRFFIKEHRGYRVRRELREMVLFAMHDVLKDSPFSRLDLVSCRNLFIYLNREAQARVFDTFHFALLPGTRLFLGSSESVEDGSQHFGVIDKKHRIYAQRPTPRVGLPVPSGPGTLAMALEAQQAARDGPVVAGNAFEQSTNSISRVVRTGEPRQTSWSELHLRLLEHLAPPSILVDSEYEIVHLSPSAGRFLQYSGGEPSRNLLRAVNPSLRIELRAALYQAAQTKSDSEVLDVGVDINGESLSISIRVTPASDLGADMYLVVLQANAPALPLGPPEGAAPRPEPDPVARHLDRELERLKSHLRDTVEQYEASTEELKASNEELQAMNEELRSATEELETSREELQSINEELTTVNHELKSKVDELGHANSDMHNLMDATAIATVFLDRELRITRFTPSAVTLFNLIPTDVGRPLTDLTTQLHYSELGEDAQRVLERLVPIEREVGQADGSWYLARLLPYRTIEDRIAGVVLSFVNITERKQAEEMRLWLSAVVNSTTDAIVSFSLERTILSWNGGAERVFGYTAEEAIGQPVAMLSADGESEDTMFLATLTAALPLEHFETVRRRKDGAEIQVSLTVSPIRDDSGNVVAGTAIARDITEAKRIEAALRDSREQLRMVIENASEFAIFSTDLERRVTVWNAGAQRLLGFTEDEVLGQPADIIFTDEDRAAKAPQRESEQALREGRAGDDRFHRRKDGSLFWASGVMMQMRDADDRAVGFVKILRDQSAAREAQQAIERSQADLVLALNDVRASRDALEAADVAKDRFLAVLSHELRNPLTSITAAARLLDIAPGSGGDLQRAAEVVRRQAGAMAAQLDDLLDVSRLRLGRLTMQKRPVGISSVIEAALEATHPIIEAAGHAVAVRMPTNELEVDGDPVRLAQVVNNLLSNAAKYTPPGGHIDISAELSGNQVIVKVADDGIGMVPAEIEAMFDMFSQAPQARERAGDGLGIGLALARNIAQLHGGWIRATSNGPGSGSEFQFGLPVLRVLGARESRALPVTPDMQRPASDVLVLVADDNEDAAWSMAKLLEVSGYRTMTAAGGRRALQLAAEFNPAVLLLDVGMPDIDGHEVARRLRATHGGANLILLAMTGWGQESDVRRSLEAGFDTHLTKPIDSDQVAKLIEEQLALRRGERSAAS
ncbi:PAS domain S-box protein [Variovorax sp. OV329]|uniref:PAS domain S-box protein n=1 Tax=Variovorax sp. OV329 TaxID=1882825 RepID=UPI0008E23182|nr:PAS domain S-box protein [Variovorax sp. OV329]SFM20659.1 two-component system, chemotaxis family, CheB/CheR fusion protein [Variovorax sp. OV329]